MSRAHPVTVTVHPPGDTALNPRVGDLLLTSAAVDGPVAWAIKLGSRLRRYRAPYRRFCHTALVIDTDGTLAEALAGGVVRSPLAKYEQAEYMLVRTAVPEHDQGQILAFARSVLRARAHHGLGPMAGRALYCLTMAQVCGQSTGTAIASGFVADALTRAGYIWPRPPFAMMPADLAEDFAVDRRVAVEGAGQGPGRGGDDG